MHPKPCACGCAFLSNPLCSVITSTCVLWTCLIHLTFLSAGGAAQPCRTYRSPMTKVYFSLTTSKPNPSCPDPEPLDVCSVVDNFYMYYCKGHPVSLTPDLPQAINIQSDNSFHWKYYETNTCAINASHTSVHFLEAMFSASIPHMFPFSVNTNENKHLSWPFWS